MRDMDSLFDSLGDLFDVKRSEPETVADPVQVARERIDQVSRTGDWTDDLRILAGLLEEWDRAQMATAQVVMDGPGCVGKNHPDTARRAATEPRFGTQRYQILELIAAAGRDGMTAAEVADRIGKSRNQTASRMLELREVGFIAWKRDERFELVTRDTGSGCAGIVHVAMTRGRDLLAARNCR